MIKKKTDPKKPALRQRTSSSVNLTKTEGHYSPANEYAGGAAPRTGGTAKKTATSNLKAPTKSMMKASKKFAVKPTVSKQMRKHSRGR